MKHWFMRLAVVGVLLGGAAGVVACSDDDEAMTLADYIAALDVIDNKTTAAIDGRFEGLPEEPTVEQIREAFSGIPGELEKAADEVDELSPPDEAADLHDELIDRLRDYADATRTASDGASDAATMDEFFELSETEEFLAAQSAFETACMNMQDKAADNGITVDLGCTDEEDAAAAAEQAVQDVVRTWNAKDVDGFAALFTDAGLVSAFGGGDDVPREEILGYLQDGIGDGELVVRDIASAPTDGGADVTVLWASGKILEHYRFSLIDDGGAWKIDAQEVLDVEPPAGATLVDADLSEFAFDVDTSQITSASPIVLTGHNVGQQLHHMVLAKIPADANIDELLASDDPAGVEDIGGGEPFAPGETGTIVLADALEPGRYVLACFLPDTADPAETPHAFKGMLTDFTVQ